MTRQLPPEIREIARSLSVSAGSYLQSTIREPGTTCAVCEVPVDGYPRCFQCNQRAQADLNLADRVSSLVYAVEYESQAYKLVQNYKTPGAGPSHRTTMLALLALGLRGHIQCARKLSERSTHGWAVVPSTRGRTTLHELVRSLARRPADEVIVDYSGPPGLRELRPEYWTARPGLVLPEHVVVIDDSWVTGAHAQSVAVSLKAAGVSQVSIFTVARVLDPHWPPAEPFIRHRLTGFDEVRCPWTGGECP